MTAAEPLKSSPKRDVVRRHILGLIENTRPGTGLASERELAQQLGVSRPTVRAALDDLTRDGFLVRQRGRGTFTSPHKVTQELAAGMTAPPAEGDWTSWVVTFSVDPALPPTAARLELDAGDPVLRVTRVRLVDDEPIAIERLELPASIVPGLQPSDMESGNFYQLLRSRFDVRVAEAVQSIEPSFTNPEQAELLDVPVYSPLLQIERTTRDTAGRVVEVTRSVYRGDRYRITSTLRFDDTSG